MVDIPNLNVVLAMANELENEYDIDSRLKRYQSMNPELIELSEQQGLNAEQAPPALFVADFVVTSSEVPSELSDEDRRLTIGKSVVEGLKHRNKDPKMLMKVFYLSQKVRQAVKRNDLFLAGRGLDRSSSLMILKDVYIRPYLEVCKQLLGDGSQQWEIGVLASALKGTAPFDEIDHYLSDDRAQLPVLWEILQAYSNIVAVEQNDTMSIPNISDSQSVLLIKHGKLPNIALNNITKRPSKKEKKVVNDLLKFMEKTDKDKSILYVNGNLVGTNDNIIIARNTLSKGKPLLFLKTKAGETNVSKVLSILEQRSAEGDDWQAVKQQQRVAVDFKTVTEEKEIQVEESYNEIEDESRIEEVKENKKGLVAKLKGIFGRKSTTTKKVVKTSPVLKKKKRKVSKKEKVKKKIKKEEIIANLMPSFVADAMDVIALGDLNLFEIWDTVRESDYIIVGTLESNFATNKTTFVVEEKVGDPMEFTHTLDGLDGIVEQMVLHYFEQDADLLPNEILFVSKADNKLLNYLITFDGNKDRIVGTIAVTFEKGVAQWQEEEEEIVNRRTLQMRTRQLLAAREHTPLDTAIERIYGSEMSKAVQTIELDKALFPLQF